MVLLIYRRIHSRRALLALRDPQGNFFDKA